MPSASGNDPFPRTVLVVDDEETVLDILSSVLTRHGLTVRTASDAEGAMLLLQGERFGCVLADKNLPKKNGLEVIREARRLHPWCACMVMTGYPNAESVLEALRLGANDYLEKPFPELKLVVQKIESAMEHARIAFERSALVNTLREMQKTLDETKERSFKQQTELDVFVQVLELRVEDATRVLNIKNGQLEVELMELREKMLQLASQVGTAAQSLKVLASKASRESARPTLTVDDARAMLADFSNQLERSANDFKS